MVERFNVGRVMAEYIKIKDFADLAGVSPQSIYKKIKKNSNDFSRFIKETEEGKVISIEALSLYGATVPLQLEATIEVASEVEQPGLKVEQPGFNDNSEQDQAKKSASASSKELYMMNIETLKDEIETLKEQLKIKDEQIKAMNHALMREQSLVNQEQFLAAEQKLLQQNENYNHDVIEPKESKWKRIISIIKE